MRAQANLHAKDRGGTILYVTYNGLTEPLGRRQVVPYLIHLTERGWGFSVISFEKPETALPEHRDTVAGLLRSAGIRWLPLRYHRRPVVPATGYDVVRGWMAGVTQGRGPVLLHARSTVAAAMVRSMRPFLRAPWVFDVRGLLAEEYVDAGHWTKGGVLHRLTGRLERRFLRDADGIVLLTRRIREHLDASGILEARKPTEVIPCCVETEVFRPSQDARANVRRELCLHDAPVITYAGSLGSWYRLEDMLSFYAVARRGLRGLRLMILTPQCDLALAAVAKRPDIAGGIVVRSVPVDRMPEYLAAADAGLCFLADSHSKTASSPTKYGEYLASGLPVVANRWTGDAASLAEESAWISIEGFDDDEYERATAKLVSLLANRSSAVADARALACREFSVEIAVSRYDALYRKVLAECQDNA